jgi:hypothetical protein
MKQKIQLSEGDLSVLEIVEDKVLFGEFIRSTNEYLEEGEQEGGWAFDGYQKNMLLDESHYLSVCTGRATGKTLVMETRIIHDAVSNKYSKTSANEILLVVQNKAQLDPIFLRFSQIFRRHPFLKHFVDRNSINFSQHEIKLLNGAMIRCRIVGSSGDANIVGMHVPCIYVDESQLIGWTAWNSLLQALNSWDENFTVWVSGVPNGLREHNVLYECDQSERKFNHHRLTRLESPRYTRDQYESDLKQYGGVDGDDFVHLVKGEHGTPAFSVFDRKLMKIENYPVVVNTMNNINLESNNGMFIDLLQTPEPPDNDLLVAAIDAGFSNDPTIITLLYRRNLMWREFARYELRRIKYPVQAKIIEWLDNAYRFNMITLDAGSSGLALGQILQEQKNNYGSRLVMVDFQGTVVIGYDEEGKEEKDRIRKFTIQQLQKWSQNDQNITFSLQDEDMINELERVGFTRDMLGQPKYFVYSPTGGQKGDDHILASLLTWVYGYYNEYFSPTKPSDKLHNYKELAKIGHNFAPLR